MASRDGKAPQKEDLLVRLISAAFLIPFGLYVVYKGGVALAIACSVFAVIMAYEWVRMSASPSLGIMATLAALPVTISHVWSLPFGLAALVALSIIAGLAHPKRGKQTPQGLGFAYVAGMALALYSLRTGAWDGVTAALLIMAIVWGSDSAAYFSGRGFGGPALHPDSPSKTWSGAIGAVIFCTLCGALAAQITQGDLIVWLIAGGVISIFAQIGDLCESSIKRSYGVKDTSDFVPGHGGLLDRVDGFGFVCVFAVLLFTTLPTVVAALGLSA